MASMPKNYTRPRHAKKPQKVTFYPNLPRVKNTKATRRVDAIYITTPCKTKRRIQSDWRSKVTNNYIAKDIDEDTMQTQGNSSRSGVKNPGWRQTIVRGGDATSGYSRTDLKTQSTNYSVRSSNSLVECRGSGTYFGGFLTLERSTASIDDIAIGRLKHKLSDKVGNAQLGPPLAESREIGRLVRQINEAGMSTFKALLAAKASKGKSLAKQFGDLWLGFGFGVNPLLQDIKSATDSILHYVTRMDRRVVVSGSAHQEYVSGFRDTGSSEALTNQCFLAWTRYAHHVQSIRYVAGVDIQVRAAGNYSMADHLGLKVEALPSILWELTPYSWVVDYFTTVGSFLDDTFYTLPVTVKYLSKSYKYHSRTVSHPFVIPSSGVTAAISGNASVGIWTQFDRTKLAPTLPTRSLRLKTTDEIASHGLTKLLNLGSILAGRHGPKL